MSASNNITYKILLGGFSLAAVFSFVVFYFFPSAFNIFKNKSITNEVAGKLKAPLKKVEEVAVEDDEDDEEDEESEEEPEDDDESQEEKLFAGESDDDEDDEEETEQQKAANLAEDAFLLIKSKYEDANRLAAKLITGQSYERAAEKLSEAIELASQINVSNKDVMTLYNNRSAMYEKLGEFDKSLQDIMIVLTMDPNHIKGRTRRGRIYEAQGMHNEALKDHVYVMVLERMTVGQPSNEKKIEELSKLIAAANASKVVHDIRHNQNRPTPSKTHNFLFCRNFMETYPNTHKWRETFRATSREELLQKVDEAAEDSVERVKATVQLVLFDLAKENYTSAFETFASVEEEYCVLKLTEGSADKSETSLPAELVSLCWELRGTEHHLKCVLSQAMDDYQQAVRWNDSNVEAHLKLAGVLMELGESEKAAEIYETLLSKLSLSLVAPSALTKDVQSKETTPSAPPSTGSYHSRSNSETERGDGTPPVVCEDVDSEDEAEFADAKSTPVKESVGAPITSTATASTSITMDQSAWLAPIDAELESPKTATGFSQLSAQDIIVYRAWTLIHRANVWLARDDKLQYMTNAIARSMADVDAALSLTEHVLSVAEGRAARYTALLKSIHILTQTKQQVGETTSEEEQERNRRSIKEAARLFPLHESRLLMEADMQSADGDSDKALALVEEASRTTLKGDVTPLVMKASIMCTQVLIDIQSAPQPTSQWEYEAMKDKTGAQMKGVEVFYEQALALEPNGIEVLAQYAQFKNLVSGDFEGAVSMLRKAVPLSRSRDEALELCQLLVMNEAQWEAIRQLQEQQQ